MNYKTLFIFFCLFHVFLSAQNDYKNVYYYSEDGKKMTQQEFFKLNEKYDEYISRSYAENSNLYKILIKRRTEGTLSVEDYNKLKSNFPSVFSDNNKKFTIIEYITANPPNLFKGNKINGYVYENRFINNIHKMPDVSLHFISDQKNFPQALKVNNRKCQIIKDEKDIVKNIFYTFEMLYHNVTIIREDGKYISWYGEHGPNEVYKILNELKIK